MGLGTAGEAGRGESDGRGARISTPSLYTFVRGTPVECCVSWLNVRRRVIMGRMGDSSGTSVEAKPPLNCHDWTCAG